MIELSSIFAYAGDSPCKDIIIDGVSRLCAEKFELCGISMKTEDKIEIIRMKGKAELLGENARELGNEGRIGIAEAMAAHRCKPSGLTAPPASNEFFAAALDGAIENFDSLKAWAKSTVPIATDEDLLLALLTKMRELEPLEIMTNLSRSLQGGAGFAFIPENEEAIYIKAGARPIVAGICEDGYCVSSELFAIVPYSNKYFLIEDGELAKITYEKATVYDSRLRKIKKPLYNSFGYDAPLEGYMLSDSLSSLPFAVRDTVSSFTKNGALSFDPLKISKRTISKIDRIIITGSGESFRAGALAAYCLEALTDIPSAAIPASELKSSGVFFDRNTLLIAVSAGGESRDTVDCVRRAERFQALTLGVTSGSLSTLERECKRVIKARVKKTDSPLHRYISAALSLLLFALMLGNKNEILSDMYLSVAVKLAELLPGKVLSASKTNQNTYPCAQKLLAAESVYASGTGADYLISMEAAALIRQELRVNASALPLSELSNEGEALLNGSLVAAFITNRETLGSALYYLRRCSSLGAELIIFTTADIENEISGFESVISVTDSLPVFDTLVALSALSKTLDTAKAILAKEEEQQAG